MNRPTTGLLVHAVVSFLLAACTSEQKAATCVEGASAECACPGGSKGAQVCSAQGTFGPCQCEPGVSAAATTPEVAGEAAATPTTAGAAEGNATVAAGACEDIAGTWKTKGTCGADTCVVTQSGCSTNFSCSDGAASYAGTIKGRSLSYSGSGANGKAGSCEGTFDGTTLSGTCKSGTTSCGFSAARVNKETTARTAQSTRPVPSSTTEAAKPPPSSPAPAAAADAPACENIAGKWKTGGSCGPDVCVITQSGCSTNFSCSDGARSFRGTIKGGKVSYSGMGGSCQGTLDGSTLKGTCQAAGTTCSFTARKL